MADCYLFDVSGLHLNKSAVFMFPLEIVNFPKQKVNSPVIWTFWIEESRKKKNTRERN